MKSKTQLRQERLHAWWKEYGPYLIAGCVLAVIFTGVSAGWRAHHGARRRENRPRMIAEAHGRRRTLPPRRC